MNDVNIAKLEWDICGLIDDGKSNAEIIEWLKAKNVTTEDVIEVIRQVYDDIKFLKIS